MKNPQSLYAVYDLAWKKSPFEHQKKMAAFHHARQFSLDQSEVGTGKTLPVVTVLQRLFSEKKISKALVVCPNSITDNWQNEIASGSNLKSLILRGHKQKRIGLLSQPHLTDIYILNYEGVRVIFPHLLAMNFDALILDEIHHAKNSRAKVTKKLIQLSRGIYYRKGLTGTVITNNLMDVWSIAEIIDPRVFHTNFWGFRNRYMMDKNASKPWLKFPDWQPRPEAVSEVQKKLSTISIRFTKDEVLPFLPPVLFQKRFVDMSLEQEKAYRELKKHFITELDKGEVLAAPDILGRVIKLIEIANGFVYMEDTRQSHKPGSQHIAHTFQSNPKIEELKNILDEIGEKRVVIWAAFREEVVMIKNLLSSMEEKTFAVLSGDTKQVHRQEIIDNFNNGEFDYLIANPSCAGEGLTILAPYVIYFSRSWKLGERIQSLGRHHRPGAEKFDNVSVIDLVTRNTFDQDILKALEKKEDLLQSLSPQVWREMLG